MAFERVYTMTDYWDGPRRGIADFQGQPHLYESKFLDEDYDDVFDLCPVDHETLALALEDWAIWLRWESAFHEGRTTTATHPALPDDRARHDELAPLLAARLAMLVEPVARARARFRMEPSLDRVTRGEFLEVEWTRA